MLIGALIVACSGLPSFDQQKRLVQAGDFRIHQLTPRAFVEIWGQPTYTHQQFTHFFAMQDGRLIPQARMALGESPQGWETKLAAGDALFLAYADRGQYLVFLDERAGLSGSDDGREGPFRRQDVEVRIAIQDATRSVTSLEVSGVLLS